MTEVERDGYYLRGVIVLPKSRQRLCVCGEKVAELFVSDQCVADQSAEASRQEIMMV